jgi:hypothetical protein
MSNQYAGKAFPIDSGGMQDALDLLGADAADLWAVIGVETSGCGFQPDRRMKILFERHVFSKTTNHRFDADFPDLSNVVPGGYGPGGAAQYDRLSRAAALDSHATMLSTSWGLGQVMGYNATDVGFATVEDMIAKMADSENAQIEAMASFIKANGLDGALRTHDWTRFARGYNGPNYRINSYDTRLAANYEQLDRGGLPDLHVRAAQVYLTYLGFDPHGIDGVLGRMTRSALNDFQAKHSLPLSDQIDDQTILTLRSAAG